MDLVGNQMTTHWASEWVHLYPIAFATAVMRVPRFLRRTLHCQVFLGTRVEIMFEYNLLPNVMQEKKIGSYGNERANEIDQSADESITSLSR